MNRTRARILEAAGQLFYAHGVKSVGVDRVVAEAGIAKATLYSHFPSKQHLIVAYLQARHEGVMRSMRAQRPGPAADTASRVLQHFDTLQRKAGSPDFRGCAFLLALAENQDCEAIEQQVRAHKQAIVDLFLDELPADLVTRAVLARQLALLYDGALAQIMVQRSAGAAAMAGDCAALLLQAQGLCATYGPHRVLTNVHWTWLLVPSSGQAFAEPALVGAIGQQSVNCAYR